MLKIYRKEIADFDGQLLQLNSLEQTMDEASQTQQIVSALIDNYMRIKQNLHPHDANTQFIAHKLSQRFIFCHLKRAALLIGQQRREPDLDRKGELYVKRLRAEKIALSLANQIVETHNDGHVFKEISIHLSSEVLHHFNGDNYHANMIHSAIQLDQVALKDDVDTCREFGDRLIEENSYPLKPIEDKKRHRALAISVYKYALYLLGSAESDKAHAELDGSDGAHSALLGLQGELN